MIPWHGAIFIVRKQSIRILDPRVDLTEEIIHQRRIRFHKHQRIGKHARRQEGQAEVIEDEITMNAKVVATDVWVGGKKILPLRVDEPAF